MRIVKKMDEICGLRGVHMGMDYGCVQIVQFHDWTNLIWFSITRAGRFALQSNGDGAYFCMRSCMTTKERRKFAVPNYKYLSNAKVYVQKNERYKNI